MLGVSDLTNILQGMTMYDVDHHDDASLMSLDSMESLDSSKLNKFKGRRKRKVLIFPEWERLVDEAKNVYYIHTPSGETDWLPPCCRCGDFSTKFCIGCAASYCDKDWEKVHNKPIKSMYTERQLNKLNEFKEHKTATTEPYSANFLKEKLDSNLHEVHCIECTMKKATKMCLECWDAYCTDCYKNIHHVGALKYHRVVPYSRAVLGWVRIQKFGAEPDIYRDGASGNTTVERPEEFLSELEIVYRDSTVLFETENKKNKAIMKKLEAELEEVKKERDGLLISNLKK